MPRDHTSEGRQKTGDGKTLGALTGLVASRWPDCFLQRLTIMSMAHDALGCAASVAATREQTASRARADRQCSVYRVGLLSQQG